MGGFPRIKSASRFAALAALVATGLFTAVGVPASAQSASLGVKRIQDVAGLSPFTGSKCNVATPYYTSPGGKEGEPYVAVNPKNPSNRIAVWMDAARATDDTAFTMNGGRSWTLSIPPGIDECTGNHTQPWEASGDPWISFGPDGVAYLSTLTWAHFATPPFTKYVSVVHVQISRDGGRTWMPPVLLSGPRSVSDKPMVVADPFQARVAYEIWRNQSFGLPVGPRGKTRLYFAVTRNWGATWSAPVTIARGNPFDFFGSPQLSVLNSGELVATSSLADPSGGTDLLAWRSLGGGQVWHGPVVVRHAPDGALGPICGQSTAGADTSSAAGQQTLIEGRSVVLVTIDGPSAAAGTGEILISRSDDGGKTWRTRTAIRSAEPILLSSVSADKHGNLGLLWDEINTGAVDCAGPTIPTRSLFAKSGDGGETWSAPVTLGAAWWNLASGLRGSGGFSGYFVGDYQALASTPSGFATATVQGEPLVAGAPTITGENGVMVANVLAPPAPH
jgi:hypothetical protein